MAGRRVNVNVGVLGHIDSGKTALARALSTTASTAAFDKQPQSRERGITLDLGFSCFSVPLPARLRSALPAPPAASGAEPEPGEPQLQVTLVDCPGHASLIRTIIGGERGPGREPGSGTLGGAAGPVSELARAAAGEGAPFPRPAGPAPGARGGRGSPQARRRAVGGSGTRTRGRRTWKRFPPGTTALEGASLNGLVCGFWFLFSR